MAYEIKVDPIPAIPIFEEHEVVFRLLAVDVLAPPVVFYNVMLAEEQVGQGMLIFPPFGKESSVGRVTIVPKDTGDLSLKITAAGVEWSTILDVQGSAKKVKPDRRDMETINKMPVGVRVTRI